MSNPLLALQPYLDPGERLLWSAQPRGGIRLRFIDLFLIPFSLLWGGGALVGETVALASALQASNPLVWLFPLAVLPFALIGLYLIFGRFLVDARIRSRTFYGLTNDRILILTTFLSPQLRSLPLRSLSDISLTLRPDGSGVITFAPIAFPLTIFRNFSWQSSGPFAIPAFETIDRAKEVYDLIRTTQKTLAPTK